MTSLGGQWTTQAGLPVYKGQPSLVSASPTTSPSSPSTSRSPSTSGPSPRVQLVPHTRTYSFDACLSDNEKQAVDNTSFDSRDLSSKDFDFEDIFTYDRPQQKLARVVEVSSSTRARDWSAFSFSHYAAATAMRQKVNKHRPDIGELYTRNGRDAKRRS